MMATAVRTFAGFPLGLLEFMKGLELNNSREWFQAHRGDYEAFVLEPARDFVVAMGERLSELGEDIHAEPKVHGSIFAINRDTRFSTDKTPYKTHLDLWFWQGAASGLNRERPGYFFRLQPESLILGAGMHAFSEEPLQRYRTAVLDDEKGRLLEQVAETIGNGRVHGRTYQRVPRGLPQQHPGADWLKHSGLFAENTISPVPADIFTPHAVDFCFEQFKKVAPLQRWLVDLLPAD
jgi:uncharacterized protein (TIGR02453 family)